MSKKKRKTKKVIVVGSSVKCEKDIDPIFRKALEYFEAKRLKELLQALKFNPGLLSANHIRKRSPRVL